jgi:hypothetical protein
MIYSSYLQPSPASIGTTTDGAVLRVHGFSDEALQPPGAHSRGIRVLTTKWQGVWQCNGDFDGGK